MINVDWQPIESAPKGLLVLVAINKGELRCPVREDRYIAFAVRSDTGWTMFGRWPPRDDEHFTHWVDPVSILPKLEGEKDGVPGLPGKAEEAPGQVRDQQPKGRDK